MERALFDLVAPVISEEALFVTILFVTSVMSAVVSAALTRHRLLAELARDEAAGGAACGLVPSDRRRG